MDTPQDILRQTRAMLVGQRNLGLTGLEGAENSLLASSAAPASSLGALAEEMGNCRQCPLGAHRSRIVFGTGPASPPVMFIAEAPGAAEETANTPCQGPSGDLVDRMLRAMGLSRETVYLSHLVKCRPPQDRAAAGDEVIKCLPFLRRQISAVGPRVLVTLGRAATQALLGGHDAIARERGKWGTFDGIPVMPTFHPEYLLDHPGEKRAAWQDLQAVMTRLTGYTSPQ